VLAVADFHELLTSYTHRSNGLHARDHDSDLPAMQHQSSETVVFG